MIGIVIAIVMEDAVAGILGLRSRAATFLHRGRKGRADRALISMAVPLPVMKLDDGAILAFRTWNIVSAKKRLQLCSPLHGEIPRDLNSPELQYYQWKTINFADDVPAADNANGFYGIRITPLTLFEGAVRQAMCDSHLSCWGLVGLSGTVIEHEDGTVRGECAEPMCFWLTSTGSQLYRMLPRLQKAYPTVPLFVCTREQVITALFAVAMQQIPELIPHKG